MSESDIPKDVVLEKPPSVNELTLMLVVWIGLGLATFFAALRAWIRLKYHGRFQLDDILVAFALALLIASAVMYTLLVPPLYKLARVSSGLQPMPEGLELAKFVTDTNFFLRLQFAIILAFWTCLWTVKASFLAFFYHLSNGLKSDRILWWCVTGFTIIGYIACVISYPVSCSKFTVGSCGTKQNIDLALVSLRMSTAFDIVSDVLIMIIPWKLLWVVKLSRKEKIGIGSIVGLGIVIVVFAVIRIIVTNTSGTHPEPIWLALWSSIETSVAVIVICSTAFKVFLTKNANSSSGGAYDSAYNRAYAGRSGKDLSSKGIPLEDQSTTGRFGIYKSTVVSVERKNSSGHESNEILVR